MPRSRRHIPGLRAAPSVGLALIIVSTAGCIAGDVEMAEQVASSEQALWTPNGFPFWPDGNVAVCFQPRISLSGFDEFGTANYNLQTARIRTVIEAAFENIPGAHIDFTSWGRCSGPSVPHSRVLPVPTTDLSPPNFGSTFGGGLKIMIQSNDPMEIAAYGWQTKIIVSGSQTEEIMWTAQGTYVWGNEWDSVVEHEALHALGFDHEFLRSDITTPCGDPGDGTRGPTTGTRWTRYDPLSAANETYPCSDSSPGLSDLDKLGLAITYPDGSAIKIRAGYDFVTASGMLLRRDDRLVTDWTKRGALDAAIFGTTPTWREWFGTASGTLPSGYSQPASNLSGNGSTVSGAFNDRSGRVKTLASTAPIYVDDGLHTAMVLTAL